MCLVLKPVARVFRATGAPLRNVRKRLSMAAGLSAMERLSTVDVDETSCSRDRLRFTEAARRYIAAGGEARHLAPLEEFFGVHYVDEIVQADIECAAKAICPNASCSTRNRQVYTPVSAVLKFSAARGWCAYRRIKRPRVIRCVSPLPAAEDVDRFINAAGPSLRRISVFLIGTGRTVRETLQLDWQQVNLAHRTAQVRNPRGQIVTVTLPPRVVEMLARFMCRNGKIFRRPDGSPYSERVSAGGQLKKAVEGAQRRSGVKISPRILRQIWRSRNDGDCC